MKGFYQLCALSLLLFTAITIGHVRMVVAAAPEYQIKAAFLLNFAKFVEWPVSAFTDEKAPFILGVVGTDPLESVLDVLNGQMVKNRPVKVQRLTGTEGLRQCHMLYISVSEVKRLRDTLTALADAPVLTVSDGLEQFTQYGVSINLVLVDNKVRFEMNIGVAKKAGLSVGTQLLQVAKVVEGG